MERSLIHIDMDAFFASVELITRPELRGRPVIVAGESERGVVTAATYEARAFGIHSGMALGKAKALCPAAIRISPDRAAYSRISRGVMELFAQVTPVIEQISIDEAFLDVTGSIKRLGPARQIAEGLRQAVRDNFQITCSAGIAPSKSVAKIASKLAKPDGLLEVPPDQVEAFLRPLPVGSLWGVGPKAQAALRRLGIATIGDLADTPDALAIRALGSSAGAHLLALARGQDDEPLAVARAEKSIGTETTFDHDLPPGEEVRRAVIRLADKAAWRLREAGLACRTVSVKVRSADF
jgi:DNA polymerase-4